MTQQTSATAYPLQWPSGWNRTPSHRRRRSAFKVGSLGKARDFLVGEVRRMGGSSMVLSSNLQLRLDGLPYANQRQPEDPGVAVYFLYRKKQMSFACDAYQKVEDNAYAIAKTIEALRGIERWGASDMMERAFTGFAALPARSGVSWRECMGFRPEETVTVSQVEDRFRELARIHHPDAGGEGHRMADIIEARRHARIELTN